MTSNRTTVKIKELATLKIIQSHKTAQRKGGMRAIGVLLSHQQPKEDIVIDDAFMVPFVEELDSRIWQLDVDYLTNMLKYHQRIIRNTQMIGWYHTGSVPQKNDDNIHKCMLNYASSCILVTVDLKSEWNRNSVMAFVRDLTTFQCGILQTKEWFRIVPYAHYSNPVERVSSRHLKRLHGQDTELTTTKIVLQQSAFFEKMADGLQSICNYLMKIEKGLLPINNTILHGIQEIMNDIRALPTFDAKMVADRMERGMAQVYTAVMTRALVANQKAMEHQRRAQMTTHAAKREYKWKRIEVPGGKLKK